MSGRGPQGWDARYRARPWPHQPSPTVLQACSDLVPGRALDLAAGTGRHARWLAARGWSVTAVDFSAAGIAQGRALAGDLPVSWIVADAREWRPDGAADLVLCAYVQLGVDGLRRAAGWLARGGALVVVGHRRDATGSGPGDGPGPGDPALRHSEAELRQAARDLEVVRLAEVLRPDEGGTAVDLVLVARRPPGPSAQR